jgi:hypothetical protein
VIGRNVLLIFRVFLLFIPADVIAHSSRSTQGQAMLELVIKPIVR